MKSILASLAFLILSVSVQAQNAAFSRADQGPPITDLERAKATDEFIALLKDTRYFDYVDSRTHGIPENNTTGSFWYGNIWMDVRATKKNGQVLFTHGRGGSDNIGIRTAPYLEGACYAYRLTGEKRYAKLAQKLIRGFSSWILSGSRSAKDNPYILNRSFYPANFETIENGRNMAVDYGPDRPGIDNEVSKYVHVPGNPYFGDIWIKNQRSIDDIGQMIRGMSQVQVCRDLFDDEIKKDLDQMNALYAAWAKTVEDADFTIPSFNENLEIYLPKRELSNFKTYDVFGANPNCTGKMAVHLLHGQDVDGYRCKSGISAFERWFRDRLRNDPVEIIRSHHVSAITMAELRSHPNVAMELRKGLADRLNHDFDIVKNPKINPNLDIQDIPAEFVHAANVGVPLTSDEIRFVYLRLNQAYLGMRAPEHFSTYHLFDAEIPDGEYAYDAPNIGLYFYTIAPMIGSCSAKWVQKDVRPLFDCERVKKALSEAY